MAVQYTTKICTTCKYNIDYNLGFNFVESAPITKVIRGHSAWDQNAKEQARLAISSATKCDVKDSTSPSFTTIQS